MSFDMTLVSPKAMDDAERLIAEWNRFAGQKSYRSGLDEYSLNIWGMGIATRVMIVIGMVNEDTHPRYPDIKRFGVPKALDEDGYPGPDKTSSQWDQFCAARDEVLSYRRPAPGIPSGKLSDNDGWLVHPDECASAMAVYDALPCAVQDAVRACAEQGSDGSSGRGSNGIGSQNQRLAVIALALAVLRDGVEINAHTEAEAIGATADIRLTGGEHIGMVLASAFMGSGNREEPAPTMDSSLPPVDIAGEAATLVTAARVGCSHPPLSGRHWWDNWMNFIRSGIEGGGFTVR